MQNAQMEGNSKKELFTHWLYSLHLNSEGSSDEPTWCFMIKKIFAKENRRNKNLLDHLTWI